MKALTNTDCQYIYMTLFMLDVVYPWILSIKMQEISARGDLGTGNTANVNLSLLRSVCRWCLGLIRVDPHLCNMPSFWGFRLMNLTYAV